MMDATHIRGGGCDRQAQRAHGVACKKSHDKCGEGYRVRQAGMTSVLGRKCAEAITVEGVGMDDMAGVWRESEDVRCGCREACAMDMCGECGWVCCNEECKGYMWKVSQSKYKTYRDIRHSREHNRDNGHTTCTYRKPSACHSRKYIIGDIGKGGGESKERTSNFCLTPALPISTFGGKEYNQYEGRT